MRSAGSGSSVTTPLVRPPAARLDPNSGVEKPPLGFSRYNVAVLAGREFIVVAGVVAAAMLFILARRLRLSRPAAGAAVLILALSPLAVQYQRMVFLDNVATPWLLAAFVLALAPSRQLAAFAGAALCFSIAVLSKETDLLFLPFLGWQMWRMALTVYRVHPEGGRGSGEE